MHWNGLNVSFHHTPLCSPLYPTFSLLFIFWSILTHKCLVKFTHPHTLNLAPFTKLLDGASSHKNHPRGGGKSKPKKLTNVPPNCVVLLSRVIIIAVCLTVHQHPSLSLPPRDIPPHQTLPDLCNSLCHHRVKKHLALMHCHPSTIFGKAKTWNECQSKKVPFQNTMQLLREHF